MPSQLPRYQTGVGVIETQGTISFGNSLPISFDGNHSFSFAGWFQITGEQPTGVIVGKNQEFSLGLNQGVLYVQLAGQLAPTTASFELDSDWHYLGVTFNSNSSQGGTLSLYMDGAQIGQSDLNNVGTSNQGSPLVIGGNLYINVWTLAVYTAALTESSLAPAWQPVTSGSGLVASYNFTQAPPTDVSSNANPITFSAQQASEQINTPGVNLQNISYCVASPLDSVNPGNAGNDPYTIQAWIYPEQTNEIQYIFSNGLVDGSAVTLYLTAGNSPGQIVLNAMHGSNLATGGTLPINTWSNVAVTYDGQTLLLYVNGNAVANTSSGSMTPLLQPNLLIGAGDQSTFPTGFFQGLIQSVDVWNIAASASQISTSMLTAPYEVSGCVAIYTFTVLATNGMTGSPIGFYNGAALDSLTIQVPTQVAQLYETARQLRPTPPRKTGRRVSTNETGVMMTPVSDEKIQRAITVFDEMLPASHDAETRKARREMFVNGLTEANRALANGKPIPGTITHQLEGDDYVFYLHDAEGAEECFRLSASQTDPCTPWIISVVATIIVGFLGVFGVPFTSTRVGAALTRVLGNSRLGRAIAQVLNEEITSRTLVKIIVILFTSGSLLDLISEILADLSWWDYLFVVAGVALQFFELAFPNPSTLVVVTFILAKMAAVVIQVNSLIGQKPANCH
jgi:hypothetical protein